MIQSASLRICVIDDKSVDESPVFQTILRICGVRAAVRCTQRVTVNYENIRKYGSPELKNVVGIVTNGVPPGNKRSEAS